jgi:hypothetical protein
MSKSIRHHKKSSKQKRSSSRSRSTRSSSSRSSSRKLRADKEEKVKCCMCEKMVYLKDTLIPRECLMKHGKAAHRICEGCWWDPNSGFGLETSSHECPGCKKGLPLTKFKKEEPIFVDLTEE